MFNEAAIANWLSAGRQPNGMIIRLQGFDLGVFGGNFHTHNTLHIPPGVDVVCYSNGEDYVRGMRYAVAQARAGRVVMTVDSTNLLNARHLFSGDDAWRRQCAKPRTPRGGACADSERRPQLPAARRGAALQPCGAVRFRHPAGHRHLRQRCADGAAGPGGFPKPGGAGR